MIALTSVQMANRYIYSIGGFSYKSYNPQVDTYIKDILRLDAHDPLKEWKKIKVSLQNVLPSKCQIGVFPLPSTKDRHEFLLFGGLIHFSFR
jgi:hypothetical protein